MGDDMRGRATVTLLSETRAKLKVKFHGLSKKAARAERKRVLGVIDDALAIQQKGSQYIPAVQQGIWDGRRHLFYRDNGTFPKGLVPRVRTLCVELNLKLKRVKDLRKQKLAPGDVSRVTPSMLEGVELRDYQLEAIRSAIENGCGLLWMATNAGKSECGVAIIKVLREHRALFLVHTKALLTQARERIALRLGTIEEHIGIIGDGRFDPKHITVATVQSLTRVRGADKKQVIAKYLKSIGVLILDETHHGSAKSFYRLMQRIQAPFRFGLSGTPFGNADGNGLMVEACFGPVVARVTNEELIQRGVSARPTIRFVEVTKPELEENIDWHTAYKQGIVLNPYRNALIAGEAERFARTGKPCLIMIRELWHGENLSALLKEMKVKHAFVHGQMPSSNVEHEKARFSAGKTKVLIASPIFGEGVDIPAIRALIIADGGQSVREVLQKIGRGLRKKDGGPNVLDVVDFADTGHTWLARHSQERMNIYVDEGFEVIAQ